MCLHLKERENIHARTNKNQLSMERFYCMFKGIGRTISHIDVAVGCVTENICGELQWSLN